MTGLEVADVIALAQGGSGIRLAVSTGPDQKRYRTRVRAQLTIDGPTLRILRRHAS